MPTFVHPLWGYALDYPEGWLWEEQGEVTAFAPHRAALTPDYEGADAGHLAIRPELNPYLRPIEPRWTEYITRVGIMKGAKKLGAAPLKVGNLEGYEAELLMPAKQNRRLWIGLLAAGGIILHLMLTHPKEAKDSFQGAASRMVQSLRFVARTEGVATDAHGLPLPPEYSPAPLEAVLADTSPDEGWQTYTGEAPIAALQAFYLRELPQHGWDISAYYPFPNRSADVRFASFLAERDGAQAIVALIPYNKNPILGNLAIRITQTEG